MQEPPVDLPDDTLDAGLRTHYGLAVTAVTFLPLGQDSSAWVYRVRTADDASYFLKVRTSVANAPSLLVPRYLHDHGVAQVIAPLPTTTGTLWAEVAGYACSRNRQTHSVRTRRACSCGPCMQQDDKGEEPWPRRSPQSRSESKT